MNAKLPGFEGFVFQVSSCSSGVFWGSMSRAASVCIFCLGFRVLGFRVQLAGLRRQMTAAILEMSSQVLTWHKMVVGSPLSTTAIS